MRAQSQRPTGRLFPGRRRPLTIGFDPRSLFRGGEQGFWYDPSDLSTLFQDAAGTIPVTAVGQPVALMLDKSGRGHHQSISVPASRPILRQNATTGAYYLETDGADDYMVSASIDFRGTDKITVFAGVRKLSDAASAAICELGNNQPSTFRMYGPAAMGADKFAFESGAGFVRRAATASIAWSAPVSAVVRGVGNIGGDFVGLWLNGVASGQSLDDQGAGNYGNLPLNLFRRGGTALPWAGHFYGLIGLGRLTSATETVNTERWLARRVGVTIA